jgi:hypothetical protein
MHNVRHHLKANEQNERIVNLTPKKRPNFVQQMEGVTQNALPAINLREDSLDSARRQGTPNPWYQHQKRKLLMHYKKQLLEEEFKRQDSEIKHIHTHTHTKAKN